MRLRQNLLGLLTALTLTGGLLAHAAPEPASAGPVGTDATTTLSFVAHPDDDLLFMNPDIASDVQAGHNVWVVYMTAGEVHNRPAMPYADQRIKGARAAYARAAGVPNLWTYEAMYFNGHQLATNRLDGTNVRLVFTFVHAASGGCDTPGEDAQGDLYKMLHDDDYVAQPIDGRAPYDRASFTAMLKSIITTADPAFIRTTSSIGHREDDHVDHTSAAILAADADTTATGDTWIERNEYQGYVVRDDPATYPDNVFGYWRDEKIAIWNEYWTHDPEITDGNTWSALYGRQYQLPGRSFQPGVPWVPPGDFSEC
ncbi:PIG-L family deacetylase [Actinosynnema sp. NPDC050436]|uniref:PIG-L family deacetylase n=1 Tax=Actinosynnema sp. NPDC050436 TaxID=3155659 RepID=UPI0034098FF2